MQARVFGGGGMFRRIRIAILLYVLLFVAVGGFLAAARSTDWDAPLWVNVHVAPDAAGMPVHASILDAADLARIEAFFDAQAQSYGVALERPFRLHLAGTVDEPLPEIPAVSSLLAAVRWSLTMRWRAAVLDWQDDEPTPDIVLFVVPHGGAGDVSIERSAALRKGLIAVAHVFDDRAARAGNRVVLAHELLHTLGATDKYDPRNNLPLHPAGYAEPMRTPLHPQTRAEIMAGRIPIGPQAARIPDGLNEVEIGPLTAFEIGWLTEPPTRRDD